MSVQKNAIFPTSVDKMWATLGDPRMMSFRSDVESVNIPPNHQANQVGADFSIRYTTGEERNYQVFSRDDHKFSISWCLLPSEIPGEANAEETTISITPLTETGESLVTWSINVGSEASSAYVKSLQLGLQELLLEIRSSMFPEAAHLAKKRTL